MGAGAAYSEPTSTQSTHFDPTAQQQHSQKQTLHSDPLIPADRQRRLDSDTVKAYNISRPHIDIYSGIDHSTILVLQLADLQSDDLDAQHALLQLGLPQPLLACVCETEKPLNAGALMPHA